MGSPSSKKPYETCRFWVLLLLLTPGRRTELEYEGQDGARTKYDRVRTEFIPSSSTEDGARFVLQYGVRNLSTESRTKPESQTPVRNSFRTQISYSSTEYEI